MAEHILNVLSRRGRWFEAGAGVEGPPCALSPANRGCGGHAERTEELSSGTQSNDAGCRPASTFPPQFRRCRLISGERWRHCGPSYAHGSLEILLYMLLPPPWFRLRRIAARRMRALRLCVTLQRREVHTLLSVRRRPTRSTQPSRALAEGWPSTQTCHTRRLRVRLEPQHDCSA